MPNIDELAIELNGSSKNAETAVDNVIRALDKLKTNLNIQFGSELTTSLENLSGGLAHLNTTISGIDTAKVKDLGRALGSLSKNTGKLAGLSKFTIDTKGIQGAESAFERAFGHMSKEARDTATNLAKMYDIDPDKLGELGKRVQSLYDSKGSSVARDDLIKFIDLYGNLEKQLTYDAEKAKELQKILSSGLAIPENLRKNVTPEDFRKIQGATGIKGFKYAKNAGYGDVQQFDGPTGWAKRADDVFGGNGISGKRFQDMTDASEGFLTAIAYIDEYKGKMETTIEAAEALTMHIHEIGQAIQQTNTAMSQMPSDGWMDADVNDADMFDAGAIESKASSFDNLASSIQNVAQVIEVNPLEKLAEGLEKLSETTSYDFSNIATLSTAVGKLSGENVMAAAQAIPEIGRGIQSLNGIQIPNLEGLDILTTQLRGLGSKTIRGAADALPQIAQALRSLQGIKIPNGAELAEFAKAIAIMGRQSVQSACDNMPKLADAFNQMAIKLASAPKISENTIRLADAMSKLSTNTQRAGNSMTHAHRGLKLFGNTARNTQRSTKGLAATIGKIYATYWLLFRAFSKVRQAIGYASDLTEVQNVVDTVFGDARDKVQEFADTTIMTFGMSELSAKQFASRFQSMGTAMGITDKQVASANEFIGKSVEKTKRQIDGIKDSYKDLGKSTADMSINLTKLAADMGSFYNKEYADVAEDLESVMTGMTRPLRKYGLDLTNATLKEFAMANGMKANLKTMTQAEKTMLRYQYVMANMGHVMNDYAITADTWANVTRTIGQQFQKLGQIIGQGLVNTFKPALIKFRDFLNGLIGLVEKTLNAIGKLLGWQIEIAEVGLEGAEDSAEGIADGLGDAAGNAKKLNKQLAGFDELNNLTTPSDGGGSGGGTGGASGGSGGKSQASGGGVTYKPYESEIDSWRGLGEAIADTISRELDSIKWENVYKKAEKFGTGLADFMNGLFSGEKGKKLFESLGSTIAGAVNTVMIAAKTWADELEWEKIGSNIKDGLVKFLKDWKPEIEGEAVGGIASGIASAVYSAVSDMSAWELLGDKIGTGIQALIDRLGKKDRQGNTFWENFFGSIASIANGLSKAIIKGVEAVNWDDLGHAIVKGIKKFVKTWRPDLTGIAIGKVANAIADTLYPILSDKQTWKNLGKKIGKGITAFIKTVKWETVMGDLTGALQGIATVIAETIANVDWIEVGKAILSAIKGVLWQLASDPKGTSAILEVAATYAGFKIGKSIIKGMLAKGGIGAGVEAAKGTASASLMKWIANALGLTVGEAGLSISIPVAATLVVAWDIRSGNAKKREETMKGLYDLDKDGKRKDGKEKTTQDAINEKYAKAVAGSYGQGSDVQYGVWFFQTIKNAYQEAKGDIEKDPIELQVKIDKIKQGTLKSKDKTINDCTANLQKIRQDNLKKKQKQINTIANFNEAKDKIPDKSRNVKAVAELQKWSKGGTFDSDLTGMMAVLERKKTTKDFDKTIDNMTASISKQVTTKDLVKEIQNEKAFINKQDTKGLTKEIKGETAIVNKQDTTNLTKKIKGETAVISKQNTDNLDKTIKGETAWVKYFKDMIKPQDKKLNNFIVNVKGVGKNSTGELVKAIGGAFFGGKWHNIAQYASGGLPSHGSMFVAGEAGAEVVGHVNGRTEVLNESQLASTMYAAVSNAMSQQNAILLKQNEYLAGILSKDYGITSKDIFNATRSEATSYYNRTGRPAFQG